MPSSPFLAIGVSRNLMSSCVKPKACWRSSSDSSAWRARRSRRGFPPVELDAQVLDPLLVGLGVDDVGLELFVVDHATLLQVDQQHLAGLQAPLAHDLAIGHGQHAGFGGQDHQIVIGDQ
jgi:hypothetical protein